jgi:hypothetical protein
VSTKQISTVNHRIQRRRKIPKIAHQKTSLYSKFRCFLSFEIHEIPAYLEQKSTQKTTKYATDSFYDCIRRITSHFVCKKKKKEKKKKFIRKFQNKNSSLHSTCSIPLTARAFSTAARTINVPSACSCL